jgi:hypothetical protein
MKNILKFNPELAKNIWLELSPQRLVTMPAILLLFVFLIFSLNSGEENPWATVHYFSFYGFIFIGILWGMKSSSDAILDEYNDLTEFITLDEKDINGDSWCSCNLSYFKRKLFRRFIFYDK